MKKISLFLFCLLLCVAAQTQTISPGPSAATGDSTRRQTLKKYVTALQQTPGDNELRVKIVKLAATLKPPPPIPEEARRYYIKAVAIQKDAKTPEQAALAVTSYQQALLLAPWWASAYYNMSSALELAGRYPEAISALELYLASNPKDTRAAQDHIYAIEGEQERTAVEQKGINTSDAETAVVSNTVAGVWTSLRSGFDQKLRVDGEYLYVENLSFSPQLRERGAFARSELKKSDDRWVGKSRQRFPCQHMNQVKWCSIETDIEITSITATRIEGRSYLWRTFDCGRCEPEDRYWMDFSWIPRD